MKNYKMDQQFKNLYEKLGLIKSDGTMITLHSDCPFSDKCWKNIQDRKPVKEGKFWTITRPWVGENYEDFRLLVVGINMNEYGCYDCAIELVNQAKKEYEEGYTKNFMTETYSGTFLFHRMASYVNALIEKEGIYKPNWGNDGFPSKQDLIKSFDFFAFTNHIKCSPIEENSKPTYEMWENCGRFILKNEINVLEPSKILVLGKEENFYYFNQKVLDEPISLEWKGNIGLGKGHINNKQVEIIVVPHPASFGGNSHEIMKELNCVINNRC
jgi:hypothetical protein